MLNPCKPCICSTPSCHLCMFSYQSMEDQEERLIWLFENYVKDSQCYGYALVENFKALNPNWNELLEDYYKRVGGNNPC